MFVEGALSPNNCNMEKRGFMEKICIVKRRKRDFGPVVEPIAQPGGQVLSMELTAEQAEMLRSRTYLHHLFDEGKEPRIFFNLHFRNAFPIKILKPGDVCEILQVSRGTLGKLARAGAIKCYRIGRLRRFSMEDVMEYLSGTFGTETPAGSSADLIAETEENAHCY